MALSQSGDAKGAAEAYAELLQKRADDVELKALYAEALLNAGEEQRALEVTGSLLGSDKREVLALAAELFGRLKAFDRCVEALNKAITIQDAAELRVRRGICQHGKHDEAKAESDFQTAIKLDPKNAPAFYYLGQSSITLGKTKQAKGALKQAATLAGDTALGKAAKKALAELK
jgi:tetratricopeptide (TPR) repeat protein